MLHVHSKSYSCFFNLDKKGDNSDTCFDSSAVKLLPWLTGFLLYKLSVILLIKFALKYFVYKVTACKGHCFLIRGVLSLPDKKKKPPLRCFIWIFLVCLFFALFVTLVWLPLPPPQRRYWITIHCKQIYFKGWEEEEASKQMKMRKDLSYILCISFWALFSVL